MGMSSSMGSTRLPEEGEKIEVRCTCGKRYRVPASKAGGAVRCKSCKHRIKVPGEQQISMRTRQAILEELGIKPDAKETTGTYRCALCSAKLVGEDVKEAYGAEGLICALCRAQMGGSAIEEPSPAAGEEGKKKPKKELDTWVRQGSETGAIVRAGALGLLVLVGVAGFVNAIFAPALVVTILMAAAAGGVTAWQIHRGYKPAPKPDLLAKSRKGKPRS